MRILCKSTPLTRALAISAMLFVMLFPVGAHAAPATQAAPTQVHPPAGCSDSIQHFSDDSGHFSEDVPLQPGHTYTLDLIGRKPSLHAVAGYRSNVSYNLNHHAVPYSVDAGMFYISSQFPAKGARADLIEVPADGDPVTAYVSSGFGMDFTLRVCDKGPYSVPTPAVRANPFCGQSFSRFYNGTTHNTDSIRVDFPGTYLVTVFGNSNDLLVWYNSDYMSRQAKVPFTVSGKAPFLDVQAPTIDSEGGTYYSFFSEFPHKSSPDKLVTSVDLVLQIFSLKPSEDDSFTVKFDCVK